MQTPIAAAAAQALPGAAGAGRPNILLVISDQFRADNLGCMGLNPMNLTPNLDRMAGQGVLFRSAIANQPVCAPARATLFSGQYSEKHGVWRNGIGLKPETITLASTLRQAGYAAAYVGKWHLAPNDRTKATWGPVPRQNRGGFLDFWEGANELELVSHPYEGEIFDGDGKPMPFSGIYREDFLTSRAVRYLKNAPRQPFFLTVSYLNVHHQNDLDKFVPPKQYADRYRNPFIPQDLRPLPGTWPSQLGDYYGCVASMDDTIGTLWKTLEEQGLDKNTIVMFMSDHGCHFKTRNTEYKRSPHESSIHIPLIVRGPGFNRRVEVPELVSQIDIAPTLLQAAGVPVPPSMQGHSFLPLVERRTEGWRNEVYSQMTEFMTGRILRTPQWTYAVAAPKTPEWTHRRAAERYAEYLLYDLYADPFQHVNLAGYTQTKAVAEQLRERLRNRIAEAGDPRPAIDPPYFPYA
ncbi:MAG: sulfatase-like hydrolase/transferase [Bryobacteraceae bacterium]